jgi:hypothetical protein
MLSEQLAQLLGYAYGINSLTAGQSESSLLGWRLPITNGNFEYVPAPFVTHFEQGKAVHMLDEATAADANMLMVLNAATANGILSLPHRTGAPIARRSPTCIILAAGNVLAADEMHQAQTGLDGSTIDRFYTIKLDYDAEYEASLFGQSAPKARYWTPRATAPTTEDWKAAHDWLVALRNKVQTLKIPRIVGTRMFQKVRAAMAVGVQFREIKADLLLSWSPDELRRAQESI